MVILLTVLPWRRDGATLAECCERLNELGAHTFTGRRWTVSSLNGLTRRAAVATGERVDFFPHPGDVESERYVDRALRRVPNSNGALPA